VQPIEQRVDTLRRAHAFELEQLLLSRRWSRAEQDTLARMICDLAGRLLATGRGGTGAAEAELKALYDRHADIGFDEEAAESVEAMRASIEAATGLDLGAAGSLDELMDQARAAMAEQQRAQAEARPARGRAAPKRSAAERRAEADAATATQSLREVYRRLAAALHPDRTPPDAPPAERERRSAGMARANAAYATGDLLALLQLQLELEQVDLAQAGRLAAAQLRHVNRVLAEQLREIEQDIAEREHLFRATYGVMHVRRLDPQALAPFLKDEARGLLQAEAAVYAQRRLLMGEPAPARRLLKQVAAEFRAFDRFDEGLF
jgi:hypothetical protein